MMFSIRLNLFLSNFIIRTNQTSYFFCQGEEWTLPAKKVGADTCLPDRVKKEGFSPAFLVGKYWVDLCFTVRGHCNFFKIKFAEKVWHWFQYSPKITIHHSDFPCNGKTFNKGNKMETTCGRNLCCSSWSKITQRVQFVVFLSPLTSLEFVTYWVSLESSLKEVYIMTK